MTTRLHIRLLGDFRLESGDTLLTKVNTLRLQSLLAYLVLHRQAPQARSHLAFLLWPNSTEAQAHTNLRHQLHLLRQALPEAGDFLQTDTHALRWRSDAPFSLDVADFESAAVQSTSLMALQEAVDLYAGDLLPSCYDEWILPERERLRQRFMAALERLIALLEHEHDYALASRYAQRLRQADPLNEATYRRLMRLYALNGDQAGVQRAYQECVTILQRELAAEPSPATHALYERLRNLDVAYSPPHNLPTHLTPFINREGELAELAQLLDNPTCRLLTLLGPGGIGKSRLAIRAARQAAARVATNLAFTNGIFLILLAGVSAVDFLIPAIAEALNFAFHGPEDPQIQLLNYLREKEMLLVLDSFEHLLAGARFLVEILTKAPGVKLLVTSRERLNLHGEWLYEVRGLAVPETQNAARLEEYSAAQLFLQSARRVQRDFALSAEKNPSVVRLCQLVEGLPLGLELAASWVRLLSCEDIVQELGRSLGFLTTSLQNVPARHRSIRAVFDHSWDLLSVEERSVFRRLSVFQGGFRREAAERVAGASLPLLAALVDKSLLHWRAEGRYELHELLRQYAAENLAEIPEEKEATQDRHGLYYLEFLRQQESRLKSSQQQQAMAEIRAEVDNVRLAWQRAVAHKRAREMGQAATSLRLFYDAQNWYYEAEAIFRQAAQALARGEGLEEEWERDIAWGQVLAQQGWFLLRLGLMGKAKELFQQSLTLLRRFGAKAELADTFQNLSMVAWVVGDYIEAKSLLRESLMIFREQESLWGIALCLASLGMVAQSLGNYGEAKHLMQQGLEIFKEIGDLRLTALALSYLSPVAYMLGEYTAAKKWLQESLTLSREIGDYWNIAQCLNHLGAMTYQDDAADWVEAKRLHEESLTIYQKLGDRWGKAVSLNYLGYMTCALADYPAAKQYFLAALQLAIEGQITPIALDALVGLATLLVRQPAVSENLSGLPDLTGLGSTVKERAVELLVLVLNHPASSHEVKDKAQRLLAKLEAELPPQVIAAAQERGRARKLEEVAAEILADSDYEKLLVSS
jgi:predicted ATPase/DNA-binding SARP family transcriptional activator